MNKGKKLILLLLVVILLGGAYFAVSHFLNKEEGQDEISDELIAVSALKSEDIKKIHYLYGEEDITLLRDGENWFLESDREFPLNQSLVSVMIIEATELKASRVISDSSDTFGEYGLENPSTAIVYTLTDGKVVTYFIGNYNSFSDSYYFNIHGEEKIYLVSSSYMEAYEKGLTDLADVKPLEKISTEEVSSVNLVLDGVRTVVFNNNDGLKTVYTDSYTWFSDSTTPLDTNMAKEFAGLTVNYNQSGCADYFATEEELSSYGFDKPIMTLTVDYTVTEEIDTGETDENDLPVTETKTTNKVLNLLIGGQYNDGRYYAKDVKSEVVYLIDTDYIDSLRGFDTKTLRYSEVCLLEAENIESIKLIVDGEESVIDAKHSVDSQENPIVDYTFNGEVMTAVDFYSVYSSIQSIVSEGITDDAVENDTPYITVIYKTNRDGFSEMTLKFIPFDRSFYVVDFNGRCDILVNKRDVENIVSVLDGLKG